MGQPEPPEEPAWPLWPARQQWLIPQPRLLHRAHDGAACSKQSAPCVRCPLLGGGCAAGRSPRGPPGIRKQGRPPLEGAGEIIHEKEVAVLWPHAGRRPQAPGPRVAAVRRQAHQLQYDLVARREVRSRREPRAHASPEGEERATAPQWGPAQHSAPAARWRSASPTALRRTCARSPSSRCVPRSRWSGEAGSARPTKAS